MRTCFLCDQPARRGVLGECPRCTGRLDETEAIVPAQVVCQPRSVPADACLIDATGHVHALGTVNAIGREACDVLVYSVSVSRRHAILQETAAGWTVTDCDSHNGTFVNTETVHGATPIRDGDLLRVANIGFLFVERRPDDLAPEVEVATRPIASARLPGETESIRLLEPTRGGGGLLEVDGQSIQVTLIQLALLRMLLDRLRADQGLPGEVQGYVPSIELLTNLPWATSAPEDAHLKQVVRRLRKRLETTTIGIEGQRGFGYRLTRGASTDDDQDDDP